MAIATSITRPLSQPESPNSLPTISKSSQSNHSHPREPDPPGFNLGSPQSQYDDNLGLWDQGSSCFNPTAGPSCFALSQESPTSAPRLQQYQTISFSPPKLSQALPDVSRDDTPHTHQSEIAFGEGGYPWNLMTYHTPLPTWQQEQEYLNIPTEEPKPPDRCLDKNSTGPITNKGKLDAVGELGNTWCKAN